ncbi:MAG: O-antigen ligase family protein [Casimicrobiaceae bacterium]
MLERRLPERAAGYDPNAAIPGFRAAWERAEVVLKWAAVLLGCSIPVSVAVDNILLGVILFFWIAGGVYRRKLAAIRGNPVAWMALALFALFVVGSLYSIGPPKDVLEALIRALRLLLIPALIYLMREPVWRERGIMAFLASMLVTLVFSYLYWLGVLSGNEWLKGTRLDPVVWKAHITHNVFMAFAAFLLAQGAQDAKTRRGRIILAALCAAAVANVLLMVPGRTGIIVLLVLFVYFLGRALRVRGLVIAGVGLATLAGIVFATPDSMLHRRITLADEEFAQWRAGVPPDPTSSVGLRLEFLQNTLEIIGANPVLGVGTGGFGKAYADRFGGTGAPATKNPHNEILLMMVQFGIAGFVLLAALFVTQWRLAPRLESRSETAAARALVLTFAVTSLLSSTLLDHAEGFFFVYMSGLLFAGYRAHVPEAPGQRAQ